MQKAGPLDTLIRMLAGLPGLGNRSAQRIALHLLQNKNKSMIPLAAALKDCAEQIKTCGVCGNLALIDPCDICSDGRREQDTICVIAQVSDLWAIERTASFKGQYHVLGGVLSALDGIGPDALRIQSLVERVRNGNIKEVILALSATVDGQSTAHYIADQLAGFDVSVTKLAHGVPIGGELDYLDEGTITTALKRRSS